MAVRILGREADSMLTQTVRQVVNVLAFDTVDITAADLQKGIEIEVDSVVGKIVFLVTLEPPI